MKKLLSLLSVLTISGTAVPTTIAASPYEKEETIKSNTYNYLQTNNLNRFKRQDTGDGSSINQNNLCNLSEVPDLNKINEGDLKGSTIESKCCEGCHNKIWATLNAKYVKYLDCALLGSKTIEGFKSEVIALLSKARKVDSTCWFGSVNEDDYNAIGEAIWKHSFYFQQEAGQLLRIPSDKYKLLVIYTNRAAWIDPTNLKQHFYVALCKYKRQIYILLN